MKFNGFWPWNRKRDKIEADGQRVANRRVPFSRATGCHCFNGYGKNARLIRLR
jgi:hypothetical protein